MKEMNHPPWVYCKPKNDQLPVGLLTHLVRALQQYRRGHGSVSCESPSFFGGAFFLQLQKLHT